MKKNLLLATTILFSTSVLAGTAVIGQPHTPNALQRFLSIPITKETVTVGAQRAGAVILANKGKVALGTLAVGGVLWYNYLINHPEKMSEFFAVHPDLLDKFTQYVDYRIAHAQSQDEYDTFANVKQQLALDQNVNQAQAVSINNDPVYQQLETRVRQEVDQTVIVVEQSGRMPLCNIDVVAQLLEPKDVFHKGVNLILPNIQSLPTQSLNVNTYKLLRASYKPALVTDKLTPDHIPSYGALEKYFIAHGKILPKRDNSNLEGNSSAIMIPTKLHEIGSRTYGGRNKTKDVNGDTTMDQDAADLLEATVLDIATTAYLFYTNPQYKINPLNYISNSMKLVERNKLICMYDVK